MTNSPRNTSKTDPMLQLMDAMAFGASESIERTEAKGQRDLVNFDVLPVDILGGTEADFEALGFTFGEPVHNDPLFREATLPEGWKRQACDHAMYSDIVDETGAQRVSVFYKAASYDRNASMSLVPRPR
ncbi:hypothetical protein LCGC14_0757790 [marine sediment metagenome]|uniref:Uncharacterized protein n=1 Tax=marine sediment metagenome TaxID=412755 RepID=A0A0F9Q688_9ZZZZ